MKTILAVLVLALFSGWANAASLAEVTADVLNVRHAPSGRVVGRVTEGTVLGVIVIRDGWAQVTYQAAKEPGLIKTGWVSNDYLKSVGSQTPSQMAAYRCQADSMAAIRACVSLNEVHYDCNDTLRSRYSDRCSVKVDYQLEADYEGTNYLNVDVGCTAQLKYKVKADGGWHYDARSEIESHSFVFTGTAESGMLIDFILGTKNRAIDIRLDSADCRIQTVYQY